MTLPFSSNPSERSWACNLSMTGNATPLLSTANHNLFVCISKTTTAQLNAIVHNQSAPRESQLSRNRISHLWFKIQKPVSPREIFKSCQPFFTEQFPAPVRYSDISYYTWHNKSPDFPFILCYVPSVSLPRWGRDCLRLQKDQQMERSAEGGWIELVNMIGMVSSCEVTSND